MKSKIRQLITTLRNVWLSMGFSSSGKTLYDQYVYFVRNTFSPFVRINWHIEEDYHDKEEKIIIDELSKGKNVIICGPPGAGKSYVLNVIVEKYLSQENAEAIRRVKAYGDIEDTEVLSIYVKPTPEMFNRDGLVNFYNSYFVSWGFDAEDFTNYTVDDVVDKICYSYRVLTDKYGIRFYMVVDDFELMTDSDISYLQRFHRHGHVILLLATAPRTYPEKYRGFFDDMAVVTLLPITDVMQQWHFVNWALDKMGCNINSLTFAYLWNRLQLMVWYPGAILKTLQYTLGRLAYLYEIPLEEVKRRIALHKWGIVYKDLTILLFLFVFILFFMRFMFMRGPESWKYAIYAGLSVTGVWMYRLFGRKLVLGEENEIVDLPEHAPEWYNPIGPYVGILLHISGYIFLVFLLLFIFDRSLSWCILLGLPFAFLPDIDIGKSFINRIACSIFKILNRKIAYYLENIEFYFAHRGFFHSIWIPLIVFIITAPFAIYFKNVDIVFYPVIGVLSHLLIDALSPMGIPLFWPSRYRWVTPFASSKRVPVGSLREGTYAVLLTIACLLLYPFVKLSPTGLYEKITKDPATGIKKIVGHIGYYQLAEIQGYDIPNSQYIKKVFEVIDTTGDSLFLKDERGNVYDSSKDLVIHKLSRITIKEKKVSLVREMPEKMEYVPLVNLFLTFSDEEYYIGELTLYTYGKPISLSNFSTLKIERIERVLMGNFGYRIVMKYCSRHMLANIISETPEALIVRGEILKIKRKVSQT